MGHHPWLTVFAICFILFLIFCLVRVMRIRM